MYEVVIKIENLSKEYRYGVVSQEYLFRDLQSWWAKVRGKDDPNGRITLDVGKSDAKGKNIKTSSVKRQTSNDSFFALKDINLEIKQGEIVGIIGRNGAGKSTLLKILSRVTAPTTGSIKVKGRIGALLEVGTGFHPELTGRENVFLNGAILGMRKKEIKNKFDEIVDFAEIEKFIDTPVKRYSSGMYVRLAFAVAAHLDPEILVVDEVLAVGDAQFQKKCLGKMGDVSKNEGRTVLFVSHNMTAIKSLCSNAVILNSGMITEMGETVKTVDSYLGANLSYKLDRTWDGSALTPANDEIRMLSVSLKAIGQEQDEPFTVVTPLVFEASFQNYADNVKLNFSVVLYNMEGEAIFNTGTDSVTCPAGVVHGTFTIPGNFLNDGKYSVRLLIVKNSMTHLIDLQDLLFFEVLDTPRSEGWQGKWIGAVRPKFDWTINFKNDNK